MKEKSMKRKAEWDIKRQKAGPPALETMLDALASLSYDEVKQLAQKALEVVNNYETEITGSV